MTDASMPGNSLKLDSHVADFLTAPGRLDWRDLTRLEHSMAQRMNDEVRPLNTGNASNGKNENLRMSERRNVES